MMMDDNMVLLNNTHKINRQILYKKQREKERKIEKLKKVAYFHMKIEMCNYRNKNSLYNVCNCFLHTKFNKTKIKSHGLKKSNIQELRKQF
jgi:hypothetical protein